MQKSFLTHLVIVFLFHLFILVVREMEIPQTVARDSSDVVVMSILESRVEAPIQKPQTQPRKKKTVSKTKRNVPEEVEVEETPAQAPAQTPGVRDLLAQYKEALRAKIDSHKFYPTMSRRMGQRGTAIVAFTLLKDGHIINARVLKSSGFSRLDDAAKVAVTSVREFDPIPDEIGVNSLDLEIPVKFTDNI